MTLGYGLEDIDRERAKPSKCQLQYSIHYLFVNGGFADKCFVIYAGSIVPLGLWNLNADCSYFQRFSDLRTARSWVPR